MKKFITTAVLSLAFVSGCSLLKTRIIAVTPKDMKVIEKEWQEIRPDAQVLCDRSKDFKGKCKQVDEYFESHKDGLTLEEAEEIKNKIKEFAEHIDI